MAPSAAPCDTSDATLVRLWTAGDPHAFDELVERHAPLIYGRCRRALGDVDADDATQAVFLVMARRRDQAAATPVLAAWLMQVAANVVRNALRDRQRRRNAELSAPPLQPAVEEPPMTGFQEHLDACLGELPAAERDAITLHNLAGLTLAEVAVRTDAGVSTVKDRLNRGLERMRKAFLARGLTLSVPVLLGLLAAEAQAAAPSEVLAHLHADATPRAQRWARQPKAIMTRIAIAAAALVIIAGGVFAFAATSRSRASLPSDVTTASPPLLAAAPAINTVLDPERARSFLVVRWNDGERTAARLRRLPEVALLPPEHADIIDRVASLRSGVVVIDNNAMEPRERRVRNYRVEQQLAILPPHQRVELIQAELAKASDARLRVTVSTTSASDHVETKVEGMYPWAALHGRLIFAAADDPTLTRLRASLDSGKIVTGDAVQTIPGGWLVGTCRVSCDESVVHLEGTADPTAKDLADTERPAPGADIACSYIFDRGLPGSKPERNGGLELNVTDEGLHLSTTNEWLTAAESDEAASGPRLDLHRFDAVPAHAFLAVGLPMTARETRASVMWVTMFNATSLHYNSWVKDHPEDALSSEMRDRLQDSIAQIEGAVVMWAEPGAPIPSLTIEADLAQPVAEALIAATGLPRADDGSVSRLIGIVTVHLAWRHGRLVCTTRPGGVDALDRSGGFMRNADVQKAVAALPVRDPQLCVLLRPAACADILAPYVSMLSPEWMQRIQAYEQRLVADQAYAFLSAHQDRRGTHIEAAGLLSLIAGAMLAGQASGPMGMMRAAN